MNTLYSELLKRVESEIADLKLPETPANLYDPMRYILSLGGKRVRPVLTLLGAKLYSGHYELAISQALAIEIFHNFTLVHDDMMDGALLRRQVPTVHKKWNQDIALLSGDGMLVLAYQKMAEAKPEIVPKILSEFSSVAMEVCEGQQLDMDYAQRESVSLDDYLEMIRLKTGVLLSSSLKIGAITANVDQEKLDQLTVFAESLGLAFQVQDDYLDAFGGKEFGKSQGGDILEGKRTWLTIKALELANAEQSNRLKDAFDGKANEQRVDTVISVYRELEIDKLAQTVVKRYSTTATEVLNKIEGDNEAKETLSWLVAQLITRQV